MNEENGNGEKSIFDFVPNDSISDETFRKIHEYEAIAASSGNTGYKPIQGILDNILIHDYAGFTTYSPNNLGIVANIASLINPQTSITKIESALYTLYRENSKVYLENKKFAPCEISPNPAIQQDRERGEYREANEYFVANCNIIDYINNISSKKDQINKDCESLRRMKIEEKNITLKSEVRRIDSDLYTLKLYA